MTDNCIFCMIVRGEIPVETTLETEHALVFPDINPATPVHHLVIPKKHLPTVNAVTLADREIIGDVVYAAGVAARKLGVADSGYRLVANINRDAGQEVFHIHFHLMAGRSFAWPPG